MIIKSEAVQPKASTATSVYSAVIVDMIPPEGTVNTDGDIIRKLQVFCPDVMSGGVVDSKFASNNWIDAPWYPHNGADEYNYQIGGIVMISYQNGNVDSPQFVRFIEVSSEVIKRNRSYVNGVPVSFDQLIFDIGNDEADLDTSGIQKGVALLSALTACGGLFHTYGYDGKSFTSELEDTQFLTIFRCGKYGTEFIYKKKNNFFMDNLDEINFDYLENHRDAPIKIMRYLLENDKNYHLIDIINNTIIEFEDDSRYKKALYDKTNEADILYWYTSLSGYVYSDRDNYDQSSKISSSLKEKIKSKGLERTKPNKSQKLYALISDGSFSSNNIDLSIYRGNLRKSANASNDKLRSDLFDFIERLWNNICNDTTFNEMLGSRYAMILMNNLSNIRDQYGAITLTNRALIVCTVIASAFPVLEPIILNFDQAIEEELFNVKDKNIISFINGMKSCITDNKSLSYTAEDIAKYFTTIYFQILEFPTNKGLFKWVDDAYTGIYNKMLKGVRYIYNNYSAISSVMDDNEYNDGGSTYIWPIPGVTTITSPFGPRKSGYHTGVDLSGNECRNKQVIAVAAGTVIKTVKSYAPDTGDTDDGYGNYVKIQHSDSVTTIYAHLLRVDVEEGDRVQQGQRIGRCDNTGNSTGNHLHFEIRINGTAVDPMKYISPNKNTPSSDSSSNIDDNETTHTGYYDVPLSHDVQDYLFKLCNQYNIPSALMIALIDQESSFNPKAISSKGDYGLCQINKSNFESLRRDLGVTDFLDPKQNIYCGVYKLQFPYHNFNGDLHKALMVYNMGSNRAQKLWNNGTYTSNYSRAVVALYDKYRK